MNALNFKINASDDSNDHEIRVVIDGNDWIGEDNLGLDPVDFFRQKQIFDGGELLIGRCGCGCLGCADVSVNVRLSDDKVIWLTENNEELSFDKDYYFKFIKAASTDFSWETLGRRVERLISKIFDQKIIENEYLFDWASTRIKPNVINLSFSKKGVQKMYEFSWDGKTEDSATENAQRFYRKNFREE